MQVLKVQNLYHVYRLRDVDKPNLLDYSQSRSFLDMERVVIICAILAFQFIRAEPTGDLGPARLYFDTSRQTREIEEFVTDITVLVYLGVLAKKCEKTASVPLLHSHLLNLGLRDRLFSLSNWLCAGPCECNDHTEKGKRDSVLGRCLKTSSNCPDSGTWSVKNMVNQKRKWKNTCTLLLFDRCGNMW